MSHWYSAKDGTPMYEVPKSRGGGTRPTTLADARKLNLVPSVTTIIGLMAKPALEKWKTDQILKAVLANPYTWDDNDGYTWKKRVCALAQEETRKAADYGNKVHDALESYYKGDLLSALNKEIKGICLPVIKLIEDTFSKLEWVSEAYFSHKMGYGGKCDLHFKGNRDYPNGIILDFKTKSTENFSSVKAYNEHCQQLVAYREGLGLPKAACYNLFISVNPKFTSEMLLHKWDEKECKKSWEMFTNLVSYWKLANNIAQPVSAGG